MKTEVLLCLILLLSCVGGNSHTKEADFQKASINRNRTEADTLAINLEQSILHWKGTKMRGLGKHEGIIKLSEAYLLTSQGSLVGGSFTIDMTTAEVTDIPEDEPVPRRRLNNHLKSEDFFDTSSYPTSQLDILSVRPIDADSLSVTADLTIKDIIRTIQFTALQVDNRLFATVIFDRFLWNIAYEGNLIDRTLVDKEIEMRAKLFLE